MFTSSFINICQSVLSCEMFINIFTRVLTRRVTAWETNIKYFRIFCEIFLFLWILVKWVKWLIGRCVGLVTGSLVWVSPLGSYFGARIDHPKVTNRRDKRNAHDKLDKIFCFLEFFYIFNGICQLKYCGISPQMRSPMPEQIQNVTLRSRDNISHG